jgi:glutamate-1-semialdehyde aminotransferase
VLACVDFAKHTIVLPYNETEPLKAAFGTNKNESPASSSAGGGQRGLVHSQAGLAGILRELRRRTALLIFAK